MARAARRRGAVARGRLVARTIDAAVAAGYEEALVAFTAKSKLEPPPGVEPATTAIEVFDQARDRLEELGKTCKGLGPYTSEPDDVSQALVGCSCAADPEEVRALLWKRARWHQARPRVGVVVALGGTTVVEQPEATPWSEAHRSATRRGSRTPSRCRRGRRRPR